MPLRVRGAIAPARFASFIAAVIARQNAPTLGRDGARIIALDALPGFLRDLSIFTLTIGPGLPERDAHPLVNTLEKMGIQTLGDFGAVSADAVADRFGDLGLQARRLARGEDSDLRPREIREELFEDLELPDGASAGTQLERALEMLVDRLLTSPERKGRTILSVRLVARLAAGGSWSATQTLGAPTASAKTLCSLLRRKLDGLPSPASSLSLRASALGPAGGQQLALPDRGGATSDAHLDESIRQLRALQGGDVVLGLVSLDPDSRIPERRVALTPYVRR